MWIRSNQIFFTSNSTWVLWGHTLTRKFSSWGKQLDMSFMWHARHWYQVWWLTIWQCITPIHQIRNYIRYRAAVCLKFKHNKSCHDEITRFKCQFSSCSRCTVIILTPWQNDTIVTPPAQKWFSKQESHPHDATTK